MKKLIVTADDFGLCPEVNRAVVLAHQRGILTAASLMVGAEAAPEAARLAKENPGLKVGLHLVLVQGRSVLPREAIPALVNGDGRFSDGVVSSGVRYFFSPSARRQLAAECEAQIKRFLSYGLEIDHLNGHTHLHIHPTILDVVIGLAKKYRIPAVRLPRQSWATLKAGQAAMAAVMEPWVARTQARLKAAGIACNDEIFGLFETGAMTERAWLKVIPHIRRPVTEIYCHPASGDAPVLRRHMEGYKHVEELEALLSAEVRRRLDEAGIERTSFSAL